MSIKAIVMAALAAVLVVAADGPLLAAPCPAVIQQASQQMAAMDQNTEQVQTAKGLLAVLIVMFVLKLAAERISSRSQSEHLMLDPAELRRLREQAEARKLAASQNPTPSADPPAQANRTSVPALA